MGIGLTFCQKMLRQMNSCLELKSTVNFGSTFSFVLNMNFIIKQEQEQHQDTLGVGLLSKNQNIQMNANFKSKNESLNKMRITDKNIYKLSNKSLRSSSFNKKKAESFLNHNGENKLEKLSVRKY